MSERIVVFMLLIGISFASGTAVAQTAHEGIRPKLVHLKASGQVRSGPNASQTVDSFATGFLVSEDGRVLTVHHLVTDLGDVVPETVTIEARIGDKTSNVKSAWVIDWRLTTDLMLLKLPPALEKYSTVTLGNAQDHDDSKSIFTSGFPNDAHYREQVGNIQSRSGPGGYLWGTSLHFKAGQSGSPVYDGAGEVLGVVKGDQAGMGYFIPIGFADVLLAQIRLREIRVAMKNEIRAAMKDFEILRKQFTWSGELNPDTRVITIQYEKSVAGEPQIQSINLSIMPKGEKGGKDRSINEFSEGPILQTAKKGLAGGVFELTGLWHRVERHRADFDFDTITELQVDIVPTLTDGSVLPKKRITIDY